MIDGHNLYHILKLIFQKLDCDFLHFLMHKMYTPIGVNYSLRKGRNFRKRWHLVHGGGEMITTWF